MDGEPSAPGGEQLGQGEHLLLGLLGGVGVGEEVHHFQGNAPLGDHPGGHGGVDAAGKQAHRPASHAHGQAAGSRLRVGVDVGGVVPHLQVDGQLRVVHVHGQVGVLLVQLAAHVLGELDGGHGEALVRPLGLHLEGLGGPQPVPQVLHGGLEHGVLVLRAGPGPGQANHAEELGHGLPRAVQIAVLALRLHIHGRLLGVYLEFAVGLEAAAGVSHETVLKGTPVEPLKHQLP